MDKERRPTFTLDDLSKAKPFGEQIRDKDNAAPRVPPPAQVRTPHPRLAPPGAMGIRPSLQPVAERAAPTLPRPRTELGNQNHASREFAPLVPKSPNKEQMPER